MRHRILLGTTRAIPVWAWLLGLQLLLVLPFVTQPIHMDDSIFLDIGRNALQKPWHAMDFSYIFEGRQVPDMASHSHPPFVGYWIGLLLYLFGDGPRVHIMLHLGFLVFPVLFALGMYGLALRFTAVPAVATAVAVASPVAIVISHMLISDYPTLAFSTCAIALYVSGVDENKPFRVWASGMLSALAAFCSYPALLTSALCWLYAGIKRSRMRTAWWAPILAVAWMTAWLAYSSLYFHRFVLGRTAQYLVQAGGFNANQLAHKLIAFPIFMAGTLLLPLPLFRSALGWMRALPAIMWMTISLGLSQFYANGYVLKDRILFTVLLTLGGWMILGLFLRVRQAHSKDAVFLGVWTAAAGLQVLLAYSSGMARYLLPLLPPIALLTFLKSSEVAVTRLRRIAMVCAAMGLTLGLSLSLADFAAARTHRDIARYFGQSLGGWKDLTRFGGEWGFRNYMMEQGFRPFLSTSDDLAGGTFLISPVEAVPYNVGQDVESMMIPVWHKSWQSMVPIRLMSHTAHAGFYSSSWGLLPYSISRAPVEQITLRQVSYLSEKLPEIRLDTPSEQGAILPVPIPTGGVDIVVPVPGRLSIPYDGRGPIRVQFSCIWGNTGECPIRVFYNHGTTQVPLALQTQPSSVFFDLIQPGNGVIVLDIAGKGATANSNLTIRNWVMLPLESGL